MVALLRLKRKVFSTGTVYISTNKQTNTVSELVDTFNIEIDFFLGALTAAWGPGYRPLPDKFMGEIRPPPAPIPPGNHTVIEYQV